MDFSQPGSSILKSVANFVVPITFPRTKAVINTPARLKNNASRLAIDGVWSGIVSVSEY